MDKRRRKIAIIVMWASVVIMIAHFAVLDYSNFEFTDLLTPSSNILLIIAMYTVIVDENKKAKH